MSQYILDLFHQKQTRTPLALKSREARRKQLTEIAIRRIENTRRYYDKLKATTAY